MGARDLLRARTAAARTVPGGAPWQGRGRSLVSRAPLGGRLDVRPALGRSPAADDHAVQARGARRRPWRARVGGGCRARAGPADRAARACGRGRTGGPDRRPPRRAADGIRGDHGGLHGWRAARGRAVDAVGAVPGARASLAPDPLRVRRRRGGDERRAGQAVIPRRRLRRIRVRHRLRRLGPRGTRALAGRVRRRRSRPTPRRPRMAGGGAGVGQLLRLHDVRLPPRSAAHARRLEPPAACPHQAARGAVVGLRVDSGARGVAGGLRGLASRPHPAGDVRCLAGRRAWSASSAGGATSCTI